MRKFKKIEYTNSILITTSQLFKKIEKLKLY